MTSPDAAVSSSAVEAESLAHTLHKLTSTTPPEQYRWDSPRRFASIAQRLHLLFTTLLRSASPPNLSSPAATTAFRGISAALTPASASLSTYSSKSRLYVLVHSKTLCSTLLSSANSISSSLSLLLDSSDLFSSSSSTAPELFKKAADLCLESQSPDFKLSDLEESVYCTLQKEADEIRPTSKAVQSAILMDLARALGFDPSDHNKMADEIAMFKKDISGSSTVAERRILVSLEKSLENWRAEPCFGGICGEEGLEEEALIPAFKNFLCPLTKEVMRDAVVVVESAQTYERRAIEYWFRRCAQDARDPTCPVTGQVLRTMELRPNIGLAGAIEEWVNRNVEAQVSSAVKSLGEGEACPVDRFERVLDSLYIISEEHPVCRWRVRSAGVVELVLKFLKEQLESVGPVVRAKALMTLRSIAKDEESREVMLEAGVTRLAIRCLTGTTEEEKEGAVKLLLEFSHGEEYCMKLATEKGALVLLSSIAGNLEFPSLSNLAEEVLRKVERVEENVQHFAAAGRFQPLLTQLCEGTETTKIKAASLVGTITLANSAKEQITRLGGKMLVKMLSSSSEGKESSLQALCSLSSLDDNAAILVDFGILRGLINIISEPIQEGSLIEMELATSTLANIVSKSGHWELSSANEDGHLLQSEPIVHKLMELLSLDSTKCQIAILQILCGILSSPQVAEMAATHIINGSNIKLVISFLEHPEMDYRICALRLASLLSERTGRNLSELLIDSNMLVLLKEKLLGVQCSDGEKSEIARLFANLPLLNQEIKAVLGADLLKWVIGNLKEQRYERTLSSGRNSRRITTVVEGLLGILLHFVKSNDPEILNIVRENHLLTIFIEQIVIHSSARQKQQAALGLKHLSESSFSLSTYGNMERHASPSLFAWLGLLCGKPSTAPVLCPLHAVHCDEGSTFCLLRGNAIKPLIGLITDESTDVQIAAVEALCTLCSDAHRLRNASSILENLGLFVAVVNLSKEVRPGYLQERVVWMVERFSREENIAQEYSLDQALVKSLIEALKHGNSNTKRYAQDALTNLRQLSGVGGRNSNHSHARRH